MKRKIVLFYCFIFCFVTIAGAQQDLQRKKDSLWQALTAAEGLEKIQTYERLGGCYYAASANDDGQMDTLSKVYEAMFVEAGKQKKPKYQAIARVNILATLTNRKSYDEVIRRAPAYLDFMEKQEDEAVWQYYYLVRYILFKAHRWNGDLDAALQTAQESYEYAKKQNNEDGMGTSLISMSEIYASQDRQAEAEQCLRQAIELLKGNEALDNTLGTAYAQLSYPLLAQKRYDEVLALNKEFEELIVRNEARTGIPNEIHYANLWSNYLQYYIGTGDYDQAEIYCDKLEATPKNTGLEEYIFSSRARILASRGQYAEALASLEKMKTLTGTTDKLFMNELDRLHIDILVKMNRVDEAYQLWQDAETVRDSIRNADFAVQIDELRTQYEVDRHIAEKERNRNYFLFALAGCLTLLLLLGGVVYYNRIITKKNKKLYRQIKEQDRLADELAQMERQYRTLTAEIPEHDATTAEETAEPAPLGDKQQRDLVARLRDYLLCDKNFTNPDINRDELTAALGVNKNTLSEAVKAVTDKTMMEYIRLLQLEEARRLLDKHPQLTIEAVAFDCGFHASNTFYRLFRKHYGISPAEYRKMAKRDLGL